MNCATCRFRFRQASPLEDWDACGHPDAPVTYIPNRDAFGCTFHELPLQLDLFGGAA